MNFTVTPSFIRVVGTKEELAWLREVLTFERPGAKYTKLYRMKRWDGKSRIFNTISKVFPVGLLAYVVSKGQGQKIEVNDTRNFPTVSIKAPELKTIELRNYQKAAITQCIEAGNCIVQAATNAGKTAVFAGIIKNMYPNKTLVITHRAELLKQTVKYLKQYTGLDIGFITSTDVKLRPITVAMITTLVNRIGADQEITDFFQDTKCIIIDEVHHSQTTQYQAILGACKAPYRFGFSGTVPYEDTYHGMLVRSYLGSVVFTITNDELIEMGISARPKIFFYEVDLTERLRGIYDTAKQELEAELGAYTPQQLMKRVYELTVHRGLVQNEERNEKVFEVLNREADKSVLIVVDYIEHGEIIRDMLNRVIQASFISGSAPNRSEDLERFKKGELKILISTNIIDEGLDISNIGALVMLAGKKSRRQLLQRVGRSLRKKSGVNSVAIYDFIDYGSRYLEKHSQERYSIYKKENFEIEFL